MLKVIKKATERQIGSDWGQLGQLGAAWVWGMWIFQTTHTRRKNRMPVHPLWLAAKAHFDGHVGRSSIPKEEV